MKEDIQYYLLVILAFLVETTIGFIFAFVVFGVMWIILMFLNYFGISFDLVNNLWRGLSIIFAVISILFSLGSIWSYLYTSFAVTPGIFISGSIFYVFLTYQILINHSMINEILPYAIILKL